MRPAFAIRNMNVYWRRTEDSGRWTSEVGEREIVARLDGWDPVEPALCAKLQGYLDRTLEMLAVAAGPVEHTRCRASGDASCEFHANRVHVEEHRQRSHGPLCPGDLAGVAYELANLHEASAVAEAIEEVLHARLSLPFVELWTNAVSGDPICLCKAGRRGTGAPRCFVLQAGGETVGRLEVEVPLEQTEAELIDHLLVHFALALRNTRPIRAANAHSRPPMTEAERARLIHAAVTRWGLTRREAEVLDLVVQGMTNKQIAVKIGCEEGTVEVHVSKALKKSGAGNRAGLAARVWAAT